MSLAVMYWNEMERDPDRAGAVPCRKCRDMPYVRPAQKAEEGYAYKAGEHYIGRLAPDLPRGLIRVHDLRNAAWFDEDFDWSKADIEPTMRHLAVREEDGPLLGWGPVLTGKKGWEVVLGARRRMHAEGNDTSRPREDRRGEARDGMPRGS